MISIEDYNEAQNLVAKASRARTTGGFCIAMGIITLIVGTTVGVGCLIAGGILRSE